MKRPTSTFCVIAGWLVILAGCSFPSSQPTVARHQVGAVQTLDLGHVLEVRNVTVEGQKTGLGGWGGAAIGGAATYPGGYPASTGEIIGQAAASVAGAVAGQAVEELATRAQAQELTIQLDNGATIVVIQETPDGGFREGDRVQVNHGGFGPATVRMVIN